MQVGCCAWCVQLGGRNCLGEDADLPDRDALDVPGSTARVLAVRRQCAQRTDEALEQHRLAAARWAEEHDASVATQHAQQLGQQRVNVLCAVHKGERARGRDAPGTPCCTTQVTAPSLPL